MTVTSTRGQLMLGYVPPYYATSRVMQSVFQSEGTEFDSLRQALNETLDQYFVNTATWSLDKWESELELSTDSSLTDAERRSRIKSKIRGYGTATIQLVKNIAQAYENGTVDVVEDTAVYNVLIRFVDIKGIPPNIDNLKDILREVIPSHLNITYQYLYNVYSDLDGKYTYDQVKASGLTYQQLQTQLP